jgi:hypothetical protein
VITAGVNGNGHDRTLLSWRDRVQTKAGYWSRIFSAASE